MRTFLKEIQLLLLPLFLIALALPIKGADKAPLLDLSFDEEDEVAKDETGKTKGGTIIGGVEWVDGRFGNALKLDGESGYVEIELTPELIFTEKSSFTLELWMKSKHTRPTVTKGILGTYGPAGDELSTPCWMLYLRGDSGRCNVSFYVSEVGHLTDLQKGRVTDGKWHHIAGVRDRKAEIIRLYIDGKLIGEKNGPASNLDNGLGKAWLGNHKSLFWPVIFDEVRIWGRVLSDTEITKAMNCIRWWSIDPLEKLSMTWGSIKARY